GRSRPGAEAARIHDARDAGLSGAGAEPHAGADAGRHAQAALADAAARALPGAACLSGALAWPRCPSRAYPHRAALAGKGAAGRSGDSGLRRAPARAINPLMAAKKRSPSKRSTKRSVKRPAPARRAAADPGAAFCAAVEGALKRGEPQAISDAALRRVLTAAVRVYAAKAEDLGREIAPFLDNAVTAT